MSNNPYRGRIDAFGGYYIHFHQENIGYAGGRKKAPNIINIFSKQKKQAAATSLNAYKNLFLSNISSNSEILLEELFNNDDLLAEFDKQIQKNLEHQVSYGKLEKLMQIDRELFKKSKDSFINSFQKSGNQIKSFDMLLESLAQAAELIEGPSGGALAATLRGVKSNNTNTPNIKRMGSNLQLALAEFLNKNNGKTFSERQAQAAVEQINYLAGAMISKEAKSGAEYSKELIRKLIDNIFNVGFAEGIAAASSSTINRAVDDFLEDIELTGDKRSNLYIYRDKIGWEEYNDQAASGKADSIQKNIQMSLNLQSWKQNAEVNFNLGLSNKFYRTQHFKNLDNKTSLKISGGSGGLTLGDAIRVLFGDIYTEYLGFNVMAHRSKRGKEAQALQDLLVKRYITNFFASRGGKEDFAQYIIANGEVISVLELILYATENFMGESESVNKNSSIAISLQDVKKAEEITNNPDYNKRRRTLEVNNIINNAKMQMYIHVDRLVAAYKR